MLSTDFHMPKISFRIWYGRIWHHSAFVDFIYVLPVLLLLDEKIVFVTLINNLEGKSCLSRDGTKVGISSLTLSC